MSTSYLRFAGRRLAQAAAVVLLAYVFTFVVISVLPGDPVTNTLRNPENGFTEDEIQRIVAYYGLDQPVAVQLWQSLSHFLVGDLGVSLRAGTARGCCARSRPSSSRCLRSWSPCCSSRSSRSSSACSG
jgi:peptide/nickel transport system permease protein